jgi:hypothetical protein
MPKVIFSRGGIDWKEAFEFLDYRRCMMCGVKHGLSRRVHNFPFVHTVYTVVHCMFTVHSLYRMVLYVPYMRVPHTGQGVSSYISAKYDGSNPNRATVGSSGHATGVP